MTQTEMKKTILASKVNSLRTDVNEASLKHDLFTFFKDLQDKILTALSEYWNDDFMLQGQIDLILAPIFESQKDYYDLLLKYNMKEFRKGKQTAKRLVKIAKGDITGADKAEVDLNKGVKASFTKQKELFGTLQYSEDKLRNQTFIASESTMNRVDKEINDILADGYNSGKGIAKVRDNITKRFTQLKTWESERIARTEIHSSQSMGIMNGYETLGVEYIEWDTAHDARVRGLKKTDRANHVRLDGEIIRFGDTFSNGLSYAGDRTGVIEEWINCRCGTLPFIMPDGYTAPPNMMQFREKDLVKVDVQPIEELVKPNPVDTPTVPKPQPKPKAKPKTTAKPKAKPKAKTKTTKPKEKAKATDEPFLKGEPTVSQRIDPENKQPSTVYTYENGFELVFNENAQFTHEEIVAHINSLPEPLRNLNELKSITFKNHADRTAAGDYNPKSKVIRIFKGGTNESRLNTVNHELAHALDNQHSKDLRGWGLGSVEKYEPIFKKDNELYKTKNERTGRTRTPKIFVTNYAGRSWKKYKNQFNKQMKQWKKGSQNPEWKPKHNKMFIEDFAESTKLYLNPKTHPEFIKKYPNRAEYLKSIYGKPNFENMKVMDNAINETMLKEQQIANRELKRKKFKELSESELEMYAGEVLGSKERGKAYLQMKAELDSYEAIIKAITYDAAGYLKNAGFDSPTILKIMNPKNTNKILSEIRPKRDKYRALIENVNSKIIDKLEVPILTKTPKTKPVTQTPTKQVKPKKTSKPKQEKPKTTPKPKKQPVKKEPTKPKRITATERGANPKTTTDTYEGGLFTGLKTVEYPDGTKIKFKKQANDYDPDYPFQTLDYITIDGKTYKYHEKDVYDIFKYQDAGLTASEQKLADEWIEHYGTAAGKQFNDYKRGKLTKEQIKEFKEEEGYGESFKWLIDHEKEYDKILEKSVINEDMVSMRIQARNYAKPDATTITEKGYTSSSVGINRSDLIDVFGNARDIDSNWTILNVTPKGTKGARFQGNSIARNEGDRDMDFERELTYKQGMKWEVLLRDDKNKIMVLKPSG